MLLFQTSLGVLKNRNSPKIKVKPGEGVERQGGKLSMVEEKTQKANNNGKLVVSKK